jgi:hypothetical protein
MSDFLTRLAERQMSDAPGVAPRLPPRFAPAEPAPPAVEALPQPRPLVVASPVASLLEPAAVHPVEPRADSPAAVEQPPSTAERRAREIPLPPDRAATSAEQAVVLTPDGRPASIDEPLVAERRTPPPPSDHLPREPRAERRDEMRATSDLVPPSPRHPIPEPTVLVRRPPAVMPATRRRSERVEPTPVSAEPPVVTVTIGRVEVRAIVPPPAPERPKADVRKALSLEDYLERRHRGRS